MVFASLHLTVVHGVSEKSMAEFIKHLAKMYPNNVNLQTKLQSVCASDGHFTIPRKKNVNFEKAMNNDD